MEPTEDITDILLVDDDEDDYFILRSIIAKIPKRPFELHWTSSCKEAKKNIDEDKYGLYLIDYGLGKTNGLQLLEAIDPSKRAQPFIILTGAGDDKIERQAMKLGAADYLVKGSFSAELLSRTLRYALQRKRIEEQRIQHLLEVNRAKDEFISLASHQLRTPATGVKQYLGMVLEGFAGKLTLRQTEMLDKAYQSNERQLQIVADLLRVAQVDAGKVQLRRDDVDLAQLIEDVLREQHSSFKSRGQQVKFKAPKANVSAHVDKYTIRMVLENVIDNASKYSQTGKKIAVTLAETADSYLISVVDEGVGIKRQDQNKLFQKFSRIDNSLSTMVGGSGLGLYWAKKIMDLHEGRIGVESSIGVGTTFTICFPKQLPPRNS